MSTGSITQGMLHGLERRLFPSNQAFPFSDFADGDLLSIDRDGSVIPLTEGMRFGGVINGLGQERGRWKASLLIKGTIDISIQGLSPATKLGCKVFAVRRGRDESFSLDGPGTVIGELIDIENVEQAMGTVRIHVGAIEGSSANQ